MRRYVLLILSVVMLMLFVWVLGLNHGVTAAPLQPITPTAGTPPPPPPTGTPATATPAPSPTATTVLAAYPVPVTSFKITRSGSSARLAWYMRAASYVRGFNVMSKGHKLNRSLIRTHKNPHYSFKAPWKLHSSLKLRIVFRDGTSVGLSPIG